MEMYRTAPIAVKIWKNAIKDNLAIIYIFLCHFAAIFCHRVIFLSQILTGSLSKKWNTIKNIVNNNVIPFWLKVNAFFGKLNSLGSLFLYFYIIVVYNLDLILILDFILPHIHKIRFQIRGSSFSNNSSRVMKFRKIGSMVYCIRFKQWMDKV